jgi:hypothetical protein
MDPLTKVTLIAGIAWTYIKRFIYEKTFVITNVLRQVDGNVWIWDDGRSSLVAPTVESDNDGCWFYDALANRLSLCVAESTVSVVRRMPWMAVTLEQGGNMMDVSDHFTGLTYQSPYGTLPSIMIIRTLLTQKLGVYIGGTAIFRVYCRSDLINEKVFGADLEEENDIEEWNSSWD